MSTKIKGRYPYGEIVKRLRQADHKEISQAELARRIGVTRTCICEIESGKSQLKLDVLGKILKATNKSRKDLIRIANRLKLFDNPLI